MTGRAALTENLTTLLHDCWQNDFMTVFDKQVSINDLRLRKLNKLSTGFRQTNTIIGLQYIY